MSFYGNQYLEFQKFFYKFLLKKQGVSVENGEITPANTHDQFVINAGNDWVVIEPYAESDDGITFTHKLSESNEKQSINEVHEASSHEHDSQSITHEDCLLINDLEFDDAGHLKAIIPKYFTMPSRLYWGVLDETSAAATEE